MSTQQEPKSWGSKLAGLDKTVVGPGLVAVDTYMGIKGGEHPTVALGSALLLNAAFELAPGGLWGGLAIGAGMVGAQMAPMVGQAIDAKTSQLNQMKGNFNGGSFQSSEAQEALLSQGFNQMRNARMQNTKRMANHARGAQRVY